ncbi:Asp/Glu racemase [Falsiroseomonas selenitidurans]|uniref:Asp/Glu racemase n=1 Tax=Falsiroseomonas selenitidurans TaxID=2716335 RepID=A0ABX1EB60_9PROT|nr:Asp/Glu racemase [Falsiroseomonas selenitidurans]NKC33057.1 Asp/Glu racemase [Falsiroseomonas selenitidurans]
MTRRIACLHTAASNIALFDAACPPGVALTHAVRADLLAEAEALGGLTDAIAVRTAEAVEALAAPGIEAVLLTCSTLGPALAQARAAIPLLRADAALAEAARRGGGRVVALCAVETTLAPTAALFGAACETRLVPGAWAAFRAGDAAGYARMVAAAADAAFAEGADCVALAQASMAPAAALCRRGPPLTSPAASLAALV